MSEKASDSIETALEELYDERNRIEHAIAELERCLSNLRSDGKFKKTRSRRGWTAEARQAAAERMRNYWSQRHRANGEDIETQHVV